MMLVWWSPVNCARLWFGHSSASRAKLAMINFVFMDSLHPHAVKSLGVLRRVRILKLKLSIRTLCSNADQLPVGEIGGGFDEVNLCGFGGELHFHMAIGLACH